MSEPVGKYVGGRFVPNDHDTKAIIGYDSLLDRFYFVAIDEDGALITRNQVVDVDTLEWVNEVGGGGTSPTARYMIADMDMAGAGNWYIMRMTEATGLIRYAKGASGYAAAWTARAGQSYDLPTIF